MNFKRYIAFIFAIAAYPVFAVPTYYTDRAAFDTATGGGLSFESFEDDFSVNGTIVFTDFSVSETLGANGLAQGRTVDLVSGVLTDGTGYLTYDDNGNSVATFFTFAAPVTAFGLDIASNPGSTVTIGGSVSDSIILGNNVASFWGVVDPDGLTSFTFSASGGPNVGFDAVSYGEAELEVEVSIDIKFCSDPNAHNCKSNRGVLPVTIFGTDGFDVADIDPSTLQLCLADNLDDCTGAPRDVSFADRGNPTSDLGAAMCAINTETEEEENFLNQDGFDDLDAAFEKSEVNDLLGLQAFCDGPKNGTSQTLVIKGLTYEGMVIYSSPIDNGGIDQLVKKR